MARIDASAVLYAADLDDLRGWIGCKEQRRFDEAWKLVREDEDADWEPEERKVLERLLRRVVFDGKLYGGLAAVERYYLTQLLIDLFDEYVDQDALSEDIGLQQFIAAAAELTRGREAARMVEWLVRGRRLGGDETIWNEGPAEDVLSYFGYVTRDECPRLVQALDADPARSRQRPSGILKQVRAAADECARAELDLVSFVG